MQSGRRKPQTIEKDAFDSCGSCSQWPQTWWLKTEMYSPAVLRLEVQKSLSLGWNQGLVPSRGSTGISLGHSLAAPSSFWWCWCFLACGCLTPIFKVSSVSSVAQLCPTLCNPMDCSTSGFPVHHQLPELTQTHVHRVGDAIQPSHHPSPPAFHLFPASGSFPTSQFFASGRQSVGVSASASVLPMNIQDWFPLGLSIFKALSASVVTLPPSLLRVCVPSPCGTLIGPIGLIQDNLIITACAKALQLCPSLCHPVNCSLPGSSVHGILQARILEWVAMPASRVSSWLRDQTHICCITCIGRWILYRWVTGETPPHSVMRLLYYS